MNDKPKLKFYIKSEKLDWNGKVKTSIKEVEVPWDTYNPEKLMMESIISGDMTNIPWPFSYIDSAIKFMAKYTGDEYFNWEDFKRYVSVESEVVKSCNIKFVVYSRNKPDMKWEIA